MGDVHCGEGCVEFDFDNECSSSNYDHDFGLPQHNMTCPCCKTHYIDAEGNWIWDNSFLDQEDLDEYDNIVTIYSVNNSGFSSIMQTRMGA